jgi:hypothetical protein
MADMYQVLKRKLRGGLWDNDIGPVHDSGTALYFPVPLLSSQRGFQFAAIKPLVTVTSAMIVIRFPHNQDVCIKSLQDTANIIEACGYCASHVNDGPYRKILYFLREIYPIL